MGGGNLYQNDFENNLDFVENCLDEESDFWLDRRGSLDDTFPEDEPPPTPPPTITPKTILRKTGRSISLPHGVARCEATKKAVRFADSMGLDLEKVRYLVKNEIPSRRISFAGWTGQMTRKYAPRTPRRRLELSAIFDPPSSKADFQNRLGQNFVCLHSVSVIDCTVHGTVCVKNIAFQKKVFVRYTVNNWATFTDVDATFISGSNVGKIDSFAFSLFLNSRELLSPDYKVHFAVCFKCHDGTEYWDNNKEENYGLKGEWKAYIVEENGINGNFSFF